MNWLRPPQIDDEYERVAHYSLHYALQIFIVIALFGMIRPQTTIHFTLVPIVFVTLLGNYILLQRGHLQVAGAIFLGSVWLAITTTVFVLNGINNASFYTYVVIIVFADIIFARRRAVMLFLVLSLVSSTILAIGEWRGILPLHSTDPILIDRFFIGVVIFCTTGILAALSSSALRRNLTQLRQHKADLQARNEELEALTHKLAASEERYRLLFDNASIMAAVYDSDGNFVLINEATARGLGLARADVEGRSVHAILPPREAERIIRMHQQVLESGETTTFEGSDTLLNGETIYYVRHTIPLPLSAAMDAEKPQILGLTTDLTEQKRAIERQQALQAAEEKVDFFTEFFSTVSHDIKTPLTVMSTTLYLLNRITDPELHKQKIAVLGQQVRSLEQYIQNMLMISRAEYALDLHKTRVDAKALIGEVIDSFMPRFEQKTIQCELNYPAEEVLLEVDADQLRRVLTNLVENAINYTPASGQVEVTLTRNGQSVSIEVRDTGIGIRAADLPHIFDKFYRAEAARNTLASGSGLGLAIVKKIVELHGGDITVQSRPQQGSTFCLKLPLT